MEYQFVLQKRESSGEVRSLDKLFNLQYVINDLLSRAFMVSILNDLVDHFASLYQV